MAGLVLDIIESGRARRATLAPENKSSPRRSPPFRTRSAPLVDACSKNCLSLLNFRDSKLLRRYRSTLSARTRVLRQRRSFGPKECLSSARKRHVLLNSENKSRRDVYRSILYRKRHVVLNFENKCRRDVYLVSCIENVTWCFISRTRVVTMAIEVPCIENVARCLISRAIVVTRAIGTPFAQERVNPVEDNIRERKKKLVSLLNFES